MEVEVKKTSVQKQINGIGSVFNIKDGIVIVANGKVVNANGSFYHKETDEYAGSFNYAPGNSSVQVNDIADMAAASQDAADFIIAVEANEINLVNVE